MPKTPNELVSVITPCYNAAPFVCETMDSVAMQTYPAIEHIVVDDCSTDNSWHVIRSYQGPIIAERQDQNCGASAARNRGFARASGRYLMFLDADDLIERDTIAAMVRAIRDQADAIAICEWRRLVQQKQAWVRRPAEISLPVPGEDALQGWIESRSWVPPCAVLWRRETFERTGGWDEALSLNDDGDLMMGALVLGIQLVRASGGTAYYRNHGDSRMSMSTRLFSVQKLESQRRVLDKLVLRLDQNGRLSNYAEAISVAYHRVALRGFQQRFDDFAFDCQRRGEQLGGSRAVSRTAGGRLLTLILGLQRKERLVQWLARSGLMTRERRRTERLRKLHDVQSQGSNVPPSTA